MNCTRGENHRRAEAGACRSRWLASVLLCALVLCGSGAAVRADRADPEYVLDGSRIFWFVQISDLHVDTVLPGSDRRLEWAFMEGIPVVGPAFVVATGDLTDSTSGIIYGFGPYEEEWTRYRQYLDDAGMTADFYFDLPGNHDQYGDGDLSFYREHSMWGAATDGTQPHWTARYPFGSYLFFGLATPGNDGAQWPWDNETFTDWELDELKEVLGAEGDDADLIFLFGHHDYRNVEHYEEALSILEPYAPVRFYSHGHVHDHHVSLADDGIIRYRINSLGQSSSDNFAVWAVDANAVSIGVWDAEEAWPAVLVTAPVDAVLLDVENPWAPPVPSTCAEAPVRALVFDIEPVESVSFRFDEGEWQPMSLRPDRPQQWRGTFDATALEPGAHELTVEAAGSERRGTTIQVRIEEGPCELGDEDPIPTDEDPEPVDSAEDVVDDSFPDGAEAGDDPDRPDAGTDALDASPDAPDDGEPPGPAADASPSTGGMDIVVDAGEPSIVRPDNSERLVAEPGCGCHSGGRRSAGGSSWVLALAALAVAVVRRR